MASEPRNPSACPSTAARRSAVIEPTQPTPELPLGVVVLTGDGTEPVRTGVRWRIPAIEDGASALCRASQPDALKRHGST